MPNDNVLQSKRKVPPRRVRCSDITPLEEAVLLALALPQRDLIRRGRVNFAALVLTVSTAPPRLRLGGDGEEFRV